MQDKDPKTVSQSAAVRARLNDPGSQESKGFLAPNISMRHEVLRELPKNKDGDVKNSNPATC